MREVVKLIGFILVAIGFLGLMLADFVFNWGRVITITFAAIDAVGLVTLAYAFWVMK